TSPIASRGVPTSPSLSLTEPSSPARLCRMSSAVARLFDAMADTYDDLEPWYEHLYDVLHAILRDTIGRAPHAGARALDAGCGTGFQAALLGDLGWRTYGVDVSGGLLAVARRRLPEAVLTLASVEALPYPSGRLLLDCEHRPSLDLLWTLGSALTRDSLGYGVTPREAWHALNRREGLRLAYPGYGPLWLFTGRELRRMLGAAGFTTVRAWGVHAVTSVLPSTLLHRANPPRPLATAYRALRRLDTAVATTRPARALANSLVILAERTHPSA